MPISPAAVTTMLACARIGAVHSVVFAGFSAEALSARISDAGAKIVVTADQGIRAGKRIDLKKTVDDALAQCPDVKKVLIMRRTGAKIPIKEGRDVYLDTELEKQPEWCEPAVLDSEDPLFMLYTSGSTGKPKGIVHSQAGYLLYAALTHQLVFDIKPGDVFGCVADVGWITGHTYAVYGPLCNGVTSVLFESVPTYPDPGRYWETVQRLKMNQFYGAPTAIRTLIKFGDEWPKKYEMSSLRTLGSVGEPINHEAWEWYHDVVGKGRCSLVDTWWQTETGGIMIAPGPADPGAEVKPAIAQRPFLGQEPVLMDGKGNAMKDARNAEGALCLARAWPGIARTIHGDHQRYVDTYFKQYPGFYFTGDGAHVFADGYFAITGRMDDVINVSGHRLGTAEIEDVLDEHHDVAESAVVPFPHAIKGEGIFAFVDIKDECEDRHEEIIASLKQTVKSSIASYAVPDYFL
uniref:acetate--CoA ligase n=1 Tax=Plectus sambesii TaxID=2011161 RepID=A0A914XPJ1_9BILA